MQEPSDQPRSPLSKDPRSIGKLVKLYRNQCSSSWQVGARPSDLKTAEKTTAIGAPRSIGVNTPRLDFQQLGAPNEGEDDDIKPVTLCRPGATGMRQGSSDRTVRWNWRARYVNPEELGLESNGQEDTAQISHNLAYPKNTTLHQGKQVRLSPIVQTRKRFEREWNKAQHPGHIRSQSKQPNYVGEGQFLPVRCNKSMQSSTPELQVFKHSPTMPGFAVNPNIMPKLPQPSLSRLQNTACKEKKHHIHQVWRLDVSACKKGFRLPASTGKLIRKRPDPDQQQKLVRKSFRICAQHLGSTRAKLPTFRGEDVEQYDYHSTFLKININQVTTHRLSQSAAKAMHKEMQLRQDIDTVGASFINRKEAVGGNSNVVIGFGTTVRQVKRLLIESENQLSVSLVLPEVFARPPNPQLTLKQIHQLLVQAFTHLGVQAQILSIKKYVNCILMKQKQYNLLWFLSGRVFLTRECHNEGEEGVRSLGLQWVPSGYIYYGQFASISTGGLIAVAKEGYGVMKKASNEMFVGCWKDNHKSGWGKEYDAEGRLSLDGQFLSGRFIYPRSAPGMKQKNEGNKGKTDLSTSEAAKPSIENTP